MIDENKVLLVKRRDFPLWDLPGGTKERDESDLDCLYRETLEETGLKTVSSIKVGDFINKKTQDKQTIYISSIIGGHQILSGPETKNIKFFSTRKLPLNMIPHRRMQIKVALSNRLKFPIKKNIKDSILVSLIKRNRK